MKDKVEKNISEMMKNMMDQLKPEISKNFFTGIVLDNIDPEKLGRCKIRVYGVFEDENIPITDLPWAFPDFNFIGSNLGSFVVPPVNTIVKVYFEDDDIYRPYYTTKILKTTSLSIEKDEDYPNTMILFETDNGDYFKINRNTYEATFRHASGVLVNMDNNGNITIDNSGVETGTLTLTVKGDVNVVSQTGDVSVTANKGNIKLGGSNANTQCPNVQNCLVTGAPLTIGRQIPGTPGSVKVPL